VIGREPFRRCPDQCERNVRAASEILPVGGGSAPKQLRELGLLAFAQLGATRQ
jgi:hypothetical protein